MISVYILSVRFAYRPVTFINACAVRAVFCFFKLIFIHEVVAQIGPAL